MSVKLYFLLLYDTFTEIQPMGAVLNPTFAVEPKFGVCLVFLPGASGWIISVGYVRLGK